MEENLKNKNGITLIALVITIIVLLILAIVTIRIMTNQHIIGYANNAVTAYNEAQNNESEQLTWAEELMKNKGGSSTSGSGSSSGSQGEVGDLSELTAQERLELVNSRAVDENNINFGEGYTIANNGGDELMVVALLEKTANGEVINHVIQIVNQQDDIVYSMVLDSTMAPQGCKINTWYQASLADANSNNISGFTEYTGAAPVSSSDFTTINSPTYLNRIIESF